MGRSGSKWGRPDWLTHTANQTVADARNSFLRRELERIGGIIGNPDVAPLYDDAALMGRARAATTGKALRAATGARDVRDWVKSGQRGDFLSYFATCLALLTLGFYVGIGIWLSSRPHPASVEVVAAAAERMIFLAPLVAVHRGEVSPCE